MKPIVSVITTVYNRAKYLADCIESIQKSKFRDYEHIIVDDCSTDDSVAIARAYAEKDPRIKIFINKNNLGDYPNRNQAARHASGTYLKYVDADDLMGPWMLNVMVDSMDQFPEAAVGLMAYGNATNHEPICLNPAEAFHSHYVRGSGIFFRSPLGAIIRRVEFNQIGGFPEVQHVGDFEFWHRISSAFPVVLLPTTLSTYRVHDDQQSKDNRKDPTVPFKYFDAAIRGIANQLPGELKENQKSTIVQTIYRKQARTILAQTKRLRFRRAVTLKRFAGLSWCQIVRRAFTKAPVFRF